MPPIDDPSGKPPESAPESANELLPLLEADQVVVVKQRTRFGRRHLSRGTTLLLWALRVYVLAMFVLIAITVYRAA